MEKLANGFRDRAGLVVVAEFFFQRRIELAPLHRLVRRKLAQHGGERVVVEETVERDVRKRLRGGVLRVQRSRIVIEFHRCHVTSGLRTKSIAMSGEYVVHPAGESYRMRSVMPGMPGSFSASRRGISNACTPFAITALYFPSAYGPRSQ